ncbi:unnamed protein product [Euphydryas editha]|uniref:Uncharacterized protein n=1 Tax=Euphydryas editha TaxID=104508 RepID=A0AAU9UCS8_EUPED|nr:unnamed protein product [Euphydryas editha]
MFRFVVVFYIFTTFSTASDSNQNTSTNNNVEKNVKSSHGALGFFASLSNIQTPSNVSFFEKDENQVIVPTKIYDEYKKKKKIKKSPKRTIQKIIKKGKNRSRKIYVHQVTRQPTVTTEKFEMIDSGDVQDEDVTTSSPRKRSRKHSKVPRYPMPFHRLQSRKDTVHFRNRRELRRDDVYILKDFDEMEFVNRGKDYDIVKTHVKNYW